MFYKALSIIWPGEIKFNHLLLFVTDGAKYMSTAYITLKETFPKVIHVTCLAYGLSRVAETVRSEFPKVNSLISNVKLCFSKSSSRIRAFKTLASDIPLPPKPVITRFGTWLQAAVYYADHFDAVHQVVNSFKANDSSHIAVFIEYKIMKILKFLIILFYIYF